VCIVNFLSFASTPNATLTDDEERARMPELDDQAARAPRHSVELDSTKTPRRYGSAANQ
jgi:hypothetical protein